MLVARRDAFHPDARQPSFESARPHIARTVSMLQVVGSLLAIPVGLASAYSIYRANFSVDTTCQTLRANIITMIDKRIDAGARRILVRHDVEKFEQNCGAVDPDATLAFKNLLATDAASAAPAAPAPAVAAVKPAAAEAKRASHPAEVHEQPAKRPVAVAAVAPARRDKPASDAQWVDAVRRALVAHGEAADPAPRPALRPAQDEPYARSWTPPAAPVPVQAAAPAAPVVQPAPAAPMAQPAPVAAAATVAVEPPRAEDGHPVPPAAIPDPATAPAVAHDEPRSRIRRLIARVPLLGPIWENGRQ